jgi:carboxymethylenebutenolidase
MGSTVEIKAEDGHMFAAYSAGTADLPIALVVLDSLPAPTPHARRLADRLAAFGYRVLVPNLIDRVERGARMSYRPSEFAQSKAVRDRLGGLGVMQDVAATASLVGHERVGVLGFGWGGTAAWHAATRLTAFRGAACLYGGGIAEARQQKPHCPVQLMFAEGDRTITLADVEGIRRAQPDVKVAIYPGSHGFACEELEVFNPDTWSAARDDMLGFFRRHL